MIYDGEYFKLKWYDIKLQEENPKDRIQAKDEGEIDLVEMYMEVLDEDFPIDEDDEIQNMRFHNEDTEIRI